MKKELFVLAIGLCMIAMISCATAVVNKISPGDTIFVGEGDLDITGALGGYNTIAYWLPGDDPAVDEWYYMKKISDPELFFVDPMEFMGNSGKWYLWDGKSAGEVAFAVDEPRISLQILDAATKEDITNTRVRQGSEVNFRITTNMYNATNRAGYSPEDTFISLTVNTPDGDSLPGIVCSDGEKVSLRNLPVDTKEWYWIGEGEDHTVAAPGGGWNTGAESNTGKKIYEAGKYTIQATSDLNGMDDLYRAPDGSEYIGKTATPVKNVEIFVSGGGGGGGSL
ncbi:MAG: DUF3821 domain-containing protein [Methanospirillum sp.]|uniref:DUF3821 domain-containing protein n=1 Tax=Methanospirillum sp. TaxID=45200 RepID=UPI00236FF14E|nr:DUF3821 domain-containing protein [Methanospirillum sp.]MDD1728151.1 DUF3821 domain-containing protein [Methanospirillum sp.]